MSKAKTATPLALATASAGSGNLFGIRTSADRLHQAIAVMLKDWRDGDFELPRLAEIHMAAIKEKYREVGKALRAAAEPRMTLMRGAPEEIKRDLAAIDEKMAELKQREMCAHAAFVYEKDANIRLEKEIQRLRDVLCSIASAGGFDNIGKWARAEAKRALWPNAKAEPRRL